MAHFVAAGAKLASWLEAKIQRAELILVYRYPHRLAYLAQRPASAA
jgi:hypothetical protein